MPADLLRLTGLRARLIAVPNSIASGWALVLISLGLTIAAMVIGPQMVEAMTVVFTVTWPSAILALAGAHKLEHDKDTLIGSVEDAGDRTGDVASRPA